METETKEDSPCESSKDSIEDDMFVRALIVGSNDLFEDTDLSSLSINQQESQNENDK